MGKHEYKALLRLSKAVDALIEDKPLDNCGLHAGHLHRAQKAVRSHYWNIEHANREVKKRLLRYRNRRHNNGKCKWKDDPLNPMHSTEEEYEQWHCEFCLKEHRIKQGGQSVS